MTDRYDRMDTAELLREVRMTVMTPATVRRVPNKPKTPMKSFRIPEDIYQAAQKAAAANDETLTDVVRRSLVNYARRHKTD